MMILSANCGQQQKSHNDMRCFPHKRGKVKGKQVQILYELVTVRDGATPEGGDLALDGRKHGH